MAEPARRKHRIDRNNPAAGAMRAGVVRVMNKNAASAQMTAEQLLEESFHLAHSDRGVEKPDLIITSVAELQAHRKARRDEFEVALKRDVHKLAKWIEYAAWEAHQPCIPQARAVLQRAAEYHAANVSFWKAYITFEMKYGGVDRTRAVLNLSVQTLPAEPELWLWFAWVEELVGTDSSIRTVFTRWMQHEPEPAAWRAFARFELQRGKKGSGVVVAEEINERKKRVREVMSAFVEKHNTEDTWLFYSECEVQLDDVPRAVEVLRAAILALPHQSEYELPRLFLRLSALLERLDLIDDARMVYSRVIAACRGKPLLDVHEKIASAFTRFELVNGSDEHLTTQVFNVRRAHYESRLMVEPGNVSTWFKLIALEKASKAPYQRIAALYERASFGALPTGTASTEKGTWRSHVIMFLAHAYFLEQQGEDADAAAHVLKKGLAAVQDFSFTFSKLWIALAELHVRCLDIAGAVAILATACEHHATRKLYRRRIEILCALGRFSLARQVFEAYVAGFGSESAPWIAFAKFELDRGDQQAAYAVFERALDHPKLVDKDEVWLANVGARLERGDIDGARSSYIRLLGTTLDSCVAVITRSDDEVERTSAVNQVRKALQLFKKFEFTLGSRDAEADASKSVVSVRNMFKGACTRIRKAHVTAAGPVFSDWKDFELRHGDSASQRDVDVLQHKPDRKRSRLFEMAD